MTNQETRLNDALEEVRGKAWDALARYKFQMFGYWAGVWAELNRISGQQNPNPWVDLVARARRESCPSLGK